MHRFFRIALTACLVAVFHGMPPTTLVGGEALARDDDSERYHKKRRSSVCSARRLTGTYGFTAEGIDILAPNAIVGTLAFSGRDNGVSIAWRSSRRVQEQNPPAVCSGTFEIDDACQGSAALIDDDGDPDQTTSNCPGNAHLGFVVTNCGKEVRFLFVPGKGHPAGLDGFKFFGNAQRMDGRRECD